MQEHEIFELIFSKDNEIFEQFIEQLPGDPPDDLNITEKHKAKRQINAMLMIIAKNLKLIGGYGKPKIEIPSWDECKNNIKKCSNLNKNWGICDILDLESMFDCGEAQKKCFEFVTKGLRKTIKTFSFILK